MIDGGARGKFSKEPLKGRLDSRTDSQNGWGLCKRYTLQKDRRPIFYQHGPEQACSKEIYYTIEIFSRIATITDWKNIANFKRAILTGRRIFQAKTIKFFQKREL